MNRCVICGSKCVGYCCNKCIHNKKICLCKGCNRYTKNLDTQICDECIIPFTSIPFILCAFCFETKKLFNKAYQWKDDIHYQNQNFMLPDTFCVFYKKEDLCGILNMIKDKEICNDCFTKNNTKIFMCKWCKKKFSYYYNEKLENNGEKKLNFIKRSKSNKKYCFDCNNRLNQLQNNM